ncbi:hypothetical protein [Haloparvum sedimenti]|uniref:hypothetical protein n=1 Tax=Haloparvum sedimenti TaxID=1678448 RepID=UPI00071E859C|nr:hypothetical protein [Haloparvum sedimenti]
MAATVVPVDGLAIAVPLQIGGETVAIAAIGTAAALALVYFGVKFAAGAREYLQVRRRDAAPEDEETGGGRGSDDDDRKTDGDDRGNDSSR